MARPRVLHITPYLKDPAVPAAVMYSNVNGGDALGHTHAFFELVYVRGGSGVNIIDGRPYPMIQGDMLIMQPGDIHLYRSDEGVEVNFVNVLFTSQLWPQSEWQELLELPGLAILLGKRRGRNARKLALVPADARRALSLCARLRAEADERREDWRIAARLLVTDLLLLIARAHSGYGSLPTHAHTPEDPIARALAGMHADPARDVSVARLAHDAGLSAAWFGSRFKRQTGLPVRSFLAKLRLEEARRLLENGASITDAALAVGFRDSSYFARVFRRFAQLSPRAYRRLSRTG
jgi:AraC-like DNA-binding protein